MMSMWECGMSEKFEVLNHCDDAIHSMKEAFRILAGTDIPYVMDMLIDAIHTVEQVAGDVLVKG